MQAFVMVLREGFEAFLIVAIILAYLRTSGWNRLNSAVYAGIAVSIVLSLALGYVLMKGVNQALWEGVLGLVTIGMVGTLVIYMWRTGPRLQQHIYGHLQKVVARPTTGAMSAGVFLFTLTMITREGMETALLLLQVRDKGVLTGIILGLMASAGIAWIWARCSRLVNIKRFFQVTGIFLVLFMVQIAIYSFHEFSEAGIIPNSEAIHIATEPFSPVGIYGKWFSVVMVGTCALWLLGAWLLDRIHTALPDSKASS
jgi:high-affinity iron transporter